MTSYRPVLAVAAPAVVLVIVALNATTDALYVGGLVIGFMILGVSVLMAYEVWDERRWRRHVNYLDPSALDRAIRYMERNHPHV